MIIFLNIGITFAVFKAEGKFSVEKDMLAIKRPGNFASLGKKIHHYRACTPCGIDETNIFISLSRYWQK